MSSVCFVRGVMHVILDADISLESCVCVQTLSKTPCGEVDQRRAGTQDTIK